MQRMDLYKTIHKALRAILFETTIRVGRTDFQERDATEQTVAAVRRLLGFLEEHGAHEDRVVMPEIARLSPTAFADLQADHHRVAGLQRELEQLLHRLEDAPLEQRLSLGRRLQQRLGLLTAEHLQHMEREETRGNRLLWAHHTDEELLHMHGRILGAIPAPRMLEWAGILIPVIDTEERRVLVHGLQERLPMEELQRFTFPVEANGSRGSSVSVLPGT